MTKCLRCGRYHEDGPAIFVNPDGSVSQCEGFLADYLPRILIWTTTAAVCLAVYILIGAERVRAQRSEVGYITTAQARARNDYYARAESFGGTLGRIVSVTIDSGKCRGDVFRVPPYSIETSKLMLQVCAMPGGGLGAMRGDSCEPL